MLKLNFFTQVEQIFYILWPLRISFDFLTRYRSAVEELATNKNGPFTKHMLVLRCFIRFRVCTLLFAFFFDQSLDTKQRLALFDYIHFLQLPLEMKLMFGIMIFWTEHLFKKFYLFKSARFLCDSIMFPVIFDRNGKYFLLSKFEKEAKLDKIISTTKKYLYNFQFTSTLLSFWYASHILTLFKVAKESLDPPETTFNFCVLITALFCYICDQLNSLTLLGTFQLTCIHLLLSSFIIFTRLNVLNERFTIMAYLDVHFHRLSRAHVLTLVHICKCNEIYSNFIFMVVVVGIPCNTYFLVALFTKHLSTTTVIFFLAVLSSQLSSIFGFHYLLTKYTAKLHAHWRPLLRWYVHRSGYSRSTGFYHYLPLYDQLKANFKIETFLVKSKKRYGITYGSLTLVSISSFAKNCIHYCRFLIFSFKFLK